MFQTSRNHKSITSTTHCTRTRLWIALWILLLTLSFLRLPLWSRKLSTDPLSTTLTSYSQTYSANVERTTTVDHESTSQSASVSEKTQIITSRIKESSISLPILSTTKTKPETTLSASDSSSDLSSVSSSVSSSSSSHLSSTIQNLKRTQRQSLPRKRILRTVEEIIRDVHPLFPYTSTRQFSVILMTSWFGGNMPFFTGSYTCPASHCSISMSRMNSIFDSVSADLLLYHVAPPDYSNTNGEGIVSPANDQQMIGLMAAEGFDLVEGRSKEFYKRFNTEITFRPSSLVRDSYVHWFLNDWFKQGITSPQKAFNFSTARVWNDIWEPPVPLDQRSKKHIASWSSHYCRGARSKREDLVRALLAAGLRISIYGDTSNCLRNADEEELKKDRFGQFATMRSHKFYLAFENHRLEGYVTEKFYWALLRGQVPVVWGAPDIERYAPGQGSYIDASKFENATALAEYLTALNDDDNAYMEFHKWRTETSFEDYGDILREEITELIWISTYSLSPEAWYNCRVCHALYRYHYNRDDEKSAGVSIGRNAPKLGIKTMAESEAAAFVL